MFTVYILYSEKFDRYYIGQTNDIEKRIIRHNSGNVISTKHYRPWKIVYTKEFTTRAEAMKEETRLKAFKNRVYLENECGLRRGCLIS